MSRLTAGKKAGVAGYAENTKQPTGPTLPQSRASAGGNLVSKYKS